MYNNVCSGFKFFLNSVLVLCLHMKILSNEIAIFFFLKGKMEIEFIR